MLPAAPNAWLFPSETGLSPVRPENLWRRWIGPKLEELGLGWVNFQVLRRTNLTHLDPMKDPDALAHDLTEAPAWTIERGAS